MSPFEVTDIVFVLYKTSDPFEEIKTESAIGILRQDTDNRTKTGLSLLRLTAAYIRKIVIDLILEHVTVDLSGPEFPLHVINNDQNISFIFNQCKIYYSAIPKCRHIINPLIPQIIDTKIISSQKIPERIFHFYRLPMTLNTGNGSR